MLLHHDTLIRSIVIFQSFLGGGNCGVSAERTPIDLFFILNFRTRLEAVALGVETDFDIPLRFRLDCTGVFGGLHCRESTSMWQCMIRVTS